jgi:hypothetical protein
MGMVWVQGLVPGKEVIERSTQREGALARRRERVSAL